MNTRQLNISVCLAFFWTELFESDPLSSLGHGCMKLEVSNAAATRGEGQSEEPEPEHGVQRTSALPVM